MGDTDMKAKGSEPAPSPLARRVTRLDQINTRLIGLKRDYGTLLVTQIQQKADIYQAHMHVSHGERQGIANAQTAQIATEVQEIKSQIDALEEERDHLRFLTQWVED
jgi:hypothetical protein